MQQQPNMQNQTGAMSNPPNVISVKDEMYLTDMLSWNLLAMKKAHFYASQCNDQELKAAFNEAGRMHQQHYEKILSHLQRPNQPTPQ